MNRYRVAAYSSKRGQNALGVVPEGKSHAYLIGGRTTMCGVGLGALRLFEDLSFGHQSPTVRCPMCARAIGADH